METISESQNCEFNLLFILSDTSHLIMVQTKAIFRQLFIGSTCYIKYLEINPPYRSNISYHCLRFQC